MATTEIPVQAESVSCAVCLKEVPLAEAMIPEATDYFVHFCGLECYEKWKSQPENATKLLDNPGS